MRGFSRLLLRLGAAGLLLTAAASAVPAQQKVGVDSAVNPEASGAAPGAAPRRLVIGEDVVFNEHITTSANGQTQLLFLDESSMTVGPNSDLTIDQFVYDPKSGTGKLAMTATRGLLRYVGGKLSKQDEGVTLRTGTATLAVRGGAFIAGIAPNGRTEAVFLYGKGLAIAGTSGGFVTIFRPGFQSIINPGGQPSPPAPQPPGQLALFTRLLDGRTGGTGGAGVIPTDANVVASGIYAQTITGNLGGNQGGAQPYVTNPNPLPPNLTSTIQSAVNQSAVSSSQSTPVSVVYTGRLKNTNGQGTSRGFIQQTPIGDIAYTGTLQNGVFTANLGAVGTISFPLVTGSSSFGPQTTTSSGQTFTGTSFLSSDNSFFYATIFPTIEPNQRVFIYGGTPVNSTALQATGSTRVLAFNIQPDAALQSTIPFITTQMGGSLSNAAVSPFYVVAPATTPIGDTSTTAAARGLQVSLAINGQGTSQQSAIAVTTGQFGNAQASGLPVFTGQMRGSSLLSASGTPVALGSAVSSTIDGSGVGLYGGNAISGFVLDQTAYNSGSNGTVGTAIIPSTAGATTLSGTISTYGFAQPATPTAVPSGIGSNRTTQTLAGNFGGLMYTTGQTNPYVVTGTSSISTDAPSNRIQATLNGSAQSPAAGATNLTLQFGSLSGTAGGQAFVDDNTFAATESPASAQQITVNGTTSQPNGQLYLASSGSAAPPTSLLPSGVSYCQCQYLQWGYWGGSLTDTATSRVDLGNINFWVAGLQTPLADINTLIGQAATGTYTGHAIGSVFNNGSSYVATGGFTGTYNFGTQSGTVAISNFDGRNFSATSSAPLNGASYTFAVGSSGLKGSVNGTFYGPMAAETGGSFAIQTTAAPTYLASGIFAAKR